VPASPTPPVEVLGIDHIYVTVSDLALGEAFFDPIMEFLAFKKRNRPIGGDPHAHYFNRVMQLSLRPAREAGSASAYRAGALHHLCFRVASRSDVDRAFRRLSDLGVEPTPPRLYEYRPDYYATFFSDPDGTRFEIVCDTDLRRTVRARWSELSGFVDPVSRLPTRVPAPSLTRSLTDSIPPRMPDEIVEVLANNASARVERIVSHGHASPADFWYDQDEHEFVLVVDGAARLDIEGQPPLDLGPMDWVFLEAHVRHRVAWTDPDRDTIWLAVFFRD
jgi:glyoxylase I family protein